MSEDHPHQLPQIAAEPNTMSDLRISEGLQKLLCGSLAPHHAVESIRRDAALLVEAKRVAKDLRRLAQPCGDEAVPATLEPLVRVYGLPEGARAKSFWKLYIQALRELPACALREAVTDYSALPESLFFPKPGQLKALAEKRAEAVYKAAARAKEAADQGALKRNPQSAPEPDERSAALDRARELERSVPIRIRCDLPMSQWPAEYRAMIEEADQLRRGAR